jgi:hypothetical protein
LTPKGASQCSVKSHETLGVEVTKKLQQWSLFIAALAIGGCAGPNPNIGTRTADAAYQRGDCVKAMDIYEPKAEAGQPWAQTRLGIVYYEGRCRPRDYAKSISWLKKAATYEPKTNWEKGHEFSTGPVGYFNTSTSSAIASSVLAHLYMEGTGVDKNIVTAWLWANYAVLMTAYDKDKPRVEQDRMAIEREMTSEQLQRAKNLAKSWTPKNAL